MIYHTQSGGVLDKELWQSSTVYSYKEWYSIFYESSPENALPSRLAKGAESCSSISWSLSETAHVVILLPLILCCSAKATWFWMRYIQALMWHNGQHELLISCDTALQSLITLFCYIAENIILTGSRHQEALSAETIHQTILWSWRCYLLLVDCAEAANKTSNEAEYDMAPMHNNPGAYLDSESGSELETAYLASSRTRQTKFQKLRALPNVHVRLHLASIVQELAIAWIQMC